MSVGRPPLSRVAFPCDLRPSETSDFQSAIPGPPLLSPVSCLLNSLRYPSYTSYPSAPLAADAIPLLPPVSLPRVVFGAVSPPRIFTTYYVAFRSCLLFSAARYVFPLPACKVFPYKETSPPHLPAQPNAW